MIQYFKESVLPKVTFITEDGEQVVAENAEGNLMEIALEHHVDGITGDCGGLCSCGTCHVQIDPAWIDVVGPATDDENDILEFEDAANAYSRLGCQIELTPDLDGLVVRVVTLS